MAAQIRARYGLDAQVAGDLAAAGNLVLPVLDGLDEMDPDTGDPVRATAAVAKLNEHITGFSGAPLVITCRASEYVRLAESIRPAVTIAIRPLGPGEIIGYLRREVTITGQR